MNENREELNRLLQKIHLQEENGIETSDEDVIKLLTLSSEPLSSDDPVFNLSAEQLRDLNRLTYAKNFSRVIPQKYEPWTVLENCLLPDIKKIIDGVESITESEMESKEKRECYIKQEELLWIWQDLFGDICQMIISNAEVCDDEDAELAADFLLTGTTEEFDLCVKGWTDAVHDKEEAGEFTFDGYYGGPYLDFYRYFHKVLAHTVATKSEDEIYYYHVSMLLLLIAFRTDVMLNRRLKNEKYHERTKPPKRYD